jgi:predicted esterase
MRDEYGTNWPLIVSGAITLHAVENAPVATSPRQFPLVIFLHGMGASSFGYSALIEDLVSHGYVIAAIEDTYLASAVVFPNGRVIAFGPPVLASGGSPAERLEQMIASAKKGAQRSAADIRFVLDRISQLDRATAKPSFLAGRLDLTEVAAVGHSAGGTAAARACQLEKRFAACISLDGEVNPDGAWFNFVNAKEVEHPFLLLEVHRPGLTDAQLARMGETRAEFDEFISRKESQLRSCRADCYDVALKAPRMVHGSFSDFPLLESDRDPAQVRTARHNLELIESLTRAFLDEYLKHENEPPFDGSTGKSSEVSVTQFAKSAETSNAVH